MNGVRKSADHAALWCDLNLGNEPADATDRSLPPTFVGASHVSRKVDFGWHQVGMVERSGGGRAKIRWDPVRVTIRCGSERFERHAGEAVAAIVGTKEGCSIAGRLPVIAQR